MKFLANTTYQLEEETMLTIKATGSENQKIIDKAIQGYMINENKEQAIKNLKEELKKIKSPFNSSHIIIQKNNMRSNFTFSSNNPDIFITHLIEMTQKK